jgi:predicted amidohydrolase YtcJ
MYGDGALGSRGAALHKPSDSHTQLGALITSIADMKGSNFQLNFGDSANTVLLKIYKELKAKDRRWKIEHAQVVQNQTLIISN